MINKKHLLCTLCFLASYKAMSQTILPIRRYRVNDTLLLECKKLLVPIAVKCVFFNNRKESVPDTLWQKATLRGLRKYHQDIIQEDFFTLYKATTIPQLNILILTRWPGDGQMWEDIEAKFAEIRAYPQRPMMLCTDEFGFFVWDVKYKVESILLSADLNVLPRKVNGFNFYQNLSKSNARMSYDAGQVKDDFDRIYRPLPYWIAQEQIYLEHNHHLPNKERVSNYILFVLKNRSFFQNNKPYRILTYNLLRAFNKYPMPNTLRIQLSNALSCLTSVQNKKSRK